jgi:hypothetical protein
MTTTLAFLDCETTGLDARIHQPYEVCIWREDEPQPNTFGLAHDLTYADPQALKIGGYIERSHFRNMGGQWTNGPDDQRAHLIALLSGTTLVGSNPAFDAAMLTRFIGAPVWHHRLINVAEGAMWLFGWERPKGLADVTAHLRDLGYDIPEPDHTAEGDVRTTRAVYYALREVAR